MKRFLITALLAMAFAGSVLAQNVTFNIVKTDGTTIQHVMSSDAKIFYSNTQLFFDSNGETVSYDLSTLRKAYFSTIDNAEKIENQQFAIYPNPAKAQIHVVTPLATTVQIYSIDGKIVKNIEVSEDATIDISDLNAGLYIIGVGNEFSKFIKM